MSRDGVIGFRSLKDCKRFWLRTVVSWTHFWNGTPCWEWQGAKNVDGYGVVTRGVRTRSFTIGAHRLSYESFVGPIPQTFEIDHLCRNRSCVNPLHLEAVSKIVNIMRGQHPTTRNRDKVVCHRGHPLSGKNLYRHADGRRECRTCSRASGLASWRRLHGKNLWTWKTK